MVVGSPIKFNMNMARTLVGKNVNVYLKDGSVILNVKVVAAKNEKGNGGANIRCRAYKQRHPIKVSLKEILWTEQLNPYFAERA
ncbi:MAG: hypothetical protein QXM22_02765 [Candidatus Bathyarchaeia archaeon]